MGGSLAVFRLLNPNKENLLRTKIDSNPQQVLPNFDELGTTKSILNLTNYIEEENLAYYSATHYSETIKTPIRIFIDDIEDIFSNQVDFSLINIKPGMKKVSQYQEVYKFKVVIDFNSNEIFLFTNKKISHNFIRRFKKSKKLDYEKLFFDMNKIENIPELSDVWGIWEDCIGRCKKKAYFGTGVHRLQELDKEKVTSCNVKCEPTEGQEVDFVISYDCRISSNSNAVTDIDLFKMYTGLKTPLRVSNKSNISTKASEEET